MDMIQMLALAELEQHTSYARSMGWLGPAEMKQDIPPVTSEEEWDDIPF